MSIACSRTGSRTALPFGSGAYGACDFGSCDFGSLKNSRSPQQAKKMKAIKLSDFKRIDVGIILHAKAIGYPSDARLRERVRQCTSGRLRLRTTRGFKNMPPPAACLEDC
jgi:hypothetical protein